MLISTTAHLAYRSLQHRKLTILLMLFSISLSVTLLLLIDRVREDTRSSFTNTLSDTQLIVGARTGSLNLLLYSVFRLGNATNNISWPSYQELSQNKHIKWTIPISLGDSHKGFRVLGTDNNYYKHYRFGRSQPLTFQDGREFSETYDVVLGSKVAKELGYQLGDDIIISHGLGNSSFQKHDKFPFKIVGILEPTGTPVDKTVHVPLSGLEAVHKGYFPPSYDLHNASSATAITAFLVGLESPRQTFSVQRTVNEYRAEPLQAVIPGIALQELWQIMAIAEYAFLGISIVVVIVGMMGVITMLLAGMNERRREMAILRSMGARPWQLLALLMFESGIIGIASLFIGSLMSLAVLASIGPWIQSQYGISLIIGWPSAFISYVLMGYVVLAFISGAVPGWRAYRNSLHDGLQIRI